MNKLLSHNIFGMICVKALAMAVSFSVIPLYLFYFEGGKSALGEWLVFFTLLTILINFDFGISSRLKNDLLSTDMPWGLNITKAMVGNVFISTIVVVILLCLKELKLVAFISNIDNHNFYITLAFLMVLSPFRVSIPILQAKQKNWFSALVVVIPQIFILIYLLIFKFFSLGESGQVSILLYILCVITIVCYSICFLLLLKKYSIRIDWNEVSHLKALKYSKSSFPFFITQIGLIILITMNDVIYGILGSEQLVVDYQYYFRVYSFVFVSFSSITVPFWSAIRYQYVNKNYKSVKELTAYLYALLIPVFIVLVLIGSNLQYFFDLWLGHGVKKVDLGIIICFSVLSFSMCLMYVFTAILNSFDEIRFQAKALLFASLIKVLVIYFSIYLDIKLDIVILSTVISMIFVAFLVGYKAIYVSKKIEV